MVAVTVVGSRPPQPLWIRVPPGTHHALLAVEKPNVKLINSLLAAQCLAHSFGRGVVHERVSPLKRRLCVCVCVCVCEREREGGRGREREGERERERERERES